MTPLTFPAMLRKARRPWLDTWRGELPSAVTNTAPISAPVKVAAAAAFCFPITTATEAEHELVRAVGPRAQEAVREWQELRLLREDVRISVGSIRFWMNSRRPEQEAMCRLMLRARLSLYRRHTRNLHRLLRHVEAELTPRPVVRLALAAE